MKLSRAFHIIFLAALTCLAGCRATPPSRVETKLVYWTKHHVTVRGKNDVNPVAATPETIADGKQMFTSYCMVCHGLDGQNTGVPFANTISPPVPSLASPEVQAYTDGQLKWIIENGIYPSGMPPSKGDFSDDDMWRMVVYIRHLPKAGSLGDPAVYGGGK
jgi:mono/diheme cytochrome c family protein